MGSIVSLIIAHLMRGILRDGHATDNTSHYEIKTAVKDFLSRLKWSLFSQFDF
jgi:hypothetical protein